MFAQIVECLIVMLLILQTMFSPTNERRLIPKCHGVRITFQNKLLMAYVLYLMRVETLEDDAFSGSAAYS